MNPIPLTPLDIQTLTQAVQTQYANFTLALVNDHVVKLSVMTQSYYWHYHPNSDETFIVLEGVLLIDLESGTIELSAGQVLTVPSHRIHRTRPKGDRSVNLTVEHHQIETVRVDR